MTKEELTAKLAILEREIQEIKDASEKRRRDFSKAFNWFKERKNSYYHEEAELILPSWEEIFVEIGKLLANRDFRNIEGNVSELECAVEDLKKVTNREIEI